MYPPPQESSYIALLFLPLSFAEYVQQSVLKDKSSTTSFLLSFRTDFPLSFCEAKVVSSTDTSFDFSISSNTEKRVCFLLVGIVELLDF